MFHLDNPDNGWTHCRDTGRNEHYYTHAEYPNLRFTYPATLPSSQELMPRVAPDGTIFFVTRIAPARFVDIATRTTLLRGLTPFFRSASTKPPAGPASDGHGSS
jgi:hypothetical protein